MLEDGNETAERAEIAELPKRTSIWKPGIQEGFAENEVNSVSVFHPCSSVARYLPI